MNENNVNEDEFSSYIYINDFDNLGILNTCLRMPTSAATHIAKEDLEIAAQTGIIKSNRTKILDIKPDRTAMKELLTHLFEVCGKLYEDIPPVFRQSHVTLALYLKHCLMNREPNTEEFSRRHKYIQYDGLLKEKVENKVLTYNAV
ncbi:uncharacterized protein LOC133202734 [Saccostrea echinata]|uniref:uncharacterized protein LOC133202734 n=1 Tax=Saccostrea echinata TaxID=191078 RepID=UPI002A82380E|nr:uncharacterized protein LOC133202734 [Saccostrea echinata]